MVRLFDKTEIRICGQCRGTGKITKDHNYGPPSERGSFLEICPLCDGSGKVNVRKQTTVTVTAAASIAT